MPVEDSLSWWRLLVTYLGPQWRKALPLSVLLLGGIARETHRAKDAGLVRVCLGIESCAGNLRVWLADTSFWKKGLSCHGLLLEWQASCSRSSREL